MAAKNSRTFEWMLLLSVIAGVVVVAVGYYSRMIGDVQRLSFELAARNFETAVSGARAQWYVARSRGRAGAEVELYGDLTGRAGDEAPEGQDPVRLYLNEQGWPANTGSSAQARDGRQTTDECHQLWRGLLREPPPATVEETHGPEAAYRIQLTEEGACRYRHLIGDRSGQYFDYDPRSGRISVHSSPK